MTRSAEEEMAEEFDKHVLALLKEVIQKSYDCSTKDEVSRALLCFLVRVANTWQSIKTLRCSHCVKVAVLWTFPCIPSWNDPSNYLTHYLLSGKILL